MFAIRLDPQTRRRLDAACRRLRLSRSAVITRSLKPWLDQVEPVGDAWSLGEDLFDQGETAPMPDDPLRRAIRTRLNDKYRSG